MLSRVADSLYWMSRYFERADHCRARIEANYNLMLNPSKLSAEERWASNYGVSRHRSDRQRYRPANAMIKLTSDPDEESSIVSCIAKAARMLAKFASRSVRRCGNA